MDNDAGLARAMGEAHTNDRITVLEKKVELLTKFLLQGADNDWSNPNDRLTSEGIEDVVKSVVKDRVTFTVVQHNCFVEVETDD